LYDSPVRATDDRTYGQGREMNQQATDTGRSGKAAGLALSNLGRVRVGDRLPSSTRPTTPEETLDA